MFLLNITLENSGARIQYLMDFIQFIPAPVTLSSGFLANSLIELQ